MSHELRTPLNSSLILAKLLADNRDGNLSEEQVKYAQTIQSAGNDLLALISDILDLSKIEAGHMQIQVERVRTDQLVAGLTRTFEPLTAEKSLTFQTRIQPGTPEIIATDSMRLEQVLKNLLSNAVKFTEQGSVTLEVQGVEPGFVAFLVKDTGIGISPDQQEMVFEAFRQADGTSNRKHGGTGLGLSISRELAHLLGGNVRVESEPGKGSIFTLTVPAELVVSAAAKPEPVPAPKREPARRNGATQAPLPTATVHDDREQITPVGRTILVVEDDGIFCADHVRTSPRARFPMPYRDERRCRHRSRNPVPPECGPSGYRSARPFRFIGP